MIISIDLSKDIHAMDVFTALKSSLKHRRKHILRSLRLYRGQASTIRCIFEAPKGDEIYEHFSQKTLGCQIYWVKRGLHKSCKDPKRMLANANMFFFKLSRYQVILAGTLTGV